MTELASDSTIMLRNKKFLHICSIDKIYQYTMLKEVGKMRNKNRKTFSLLLLWIFDLNSQDANSKKIDYFHRNSWLFQCAKWKQIQ